MSHTNVEKATPDYIRYKLFIPNIAVGKIVLEFVNEVWHLELMQVYPERKGHGTQFLTDVLHELKQKGVTCVTVAPMPKSKTFFEKNGFSKIDGVYTRLL